MPDSRRSNCPVSCTLEIIGDKWTLLVIRDLIMGKKTYSEFEQSPESIPTNILAERLKRLQSHGIVRRNQYQERPPRYAYELTDKGKALKPVLLAMMKWGHENLADTLSLEDIRRMQK